MLQVSSEGPIRLTISLYASVECNREDGQMLLDGFWLLNQTGAHGEISG